MHVILKCIVTYDLYAGCVIYLTCEEGDLVICDSILDVKSEVCGFGKHLRSNEYGLFPLNKFVLIDTTNIVHPTLLKVCQENQSETSNYEGSGSLPDTSHRISMKSVSSPVLCSVCGEFMMGLRLEYAHCTNCNQIFHDLCWKNHKSIRRCQRNMKFPNFDLEVLKKSAMSIAEWNSEQVIQWLCCIHFYRLIEFFELKRVDGKMLEDIMPDNEDTINNGDLSNLPVWGQISDKFYRESLYLAISTLLSRSSISTDEYQTNPNSVNFRSNSCSQFSSVTDKSCYIFVSGNHKMRESSYLVRTNCFYCQRPLLGFQKQGFHCVGCRNDFHKICASQDNMPLCSETSFSDVDVLDSSVFGIPLNDQVKHTSGIPLFLMCCIEELENRIKHSSRPSCLIDSYVVSGNTEVLIGLRARFAHPFTSSLKNIDFSDLTDIEIASLIKLFLKELPEPLLTYGLYHSLMESVQDCSKESTTRSSLRLILKHLPVINSKSLAYLIKHFQNIRNSAIYSEKQKNIGKKWSSVFSKTLIWPPTIMMNMFPVLKARHNKLIQYIFEDNLLENIDDSTNFMSLSQSLSSNDLVNLKTNVDDISIDINKQEFYWGEVTKEEVNELMSGLQDGYFMVRDTSDKTPGDYTLTIRKDGENKLIKILYRNGLYGFQEPGKFKTVVDLINYYRTHSLAEYNDQLNMTLKHPLSKMHTDILGSSKSSSSQLGGEQLINALKDTNREYNDLNRTVEKNNRDLDSFQKELDEVTKCLKGTDRIQTWCISHTEHIMNLMNSTTVMREHHHKSLSILNLKLNHCAEVTKKSSVRRDDLTMRISSLQKDISSNRPNLRKLLRKQQSIIRALKDCGVSDEVFNVDSSEFEYVCENILKTLNESNPINKKETWYNPYLSRDEATPLLTGKPSGTFLIRKSRKENTFALDIVVGQSIQHCLIYCRHDYFGFVENDCNHASLEALVKTYHTRSLEGYNPQLNTTLKYPVYLQQ